MDSRGRQLNGQDPWEKGSSWSGLGTRWLVAAKNFILIITGDNWCIHVDSFTLESLLPFYAEHCSRSQEKRGMGLSSGMGLSFHLECWFALIGTLCLVLGGWS